MKDRPGAEGKEIGSDLMFDKYSPIGVLDSGIGGFSVARQLQRLMPGEELLYFGDGANIPYGNHSREQIVTLARYMFDFMQERGVKLLLVACNTISCLIGECNDGCERQSANEHYSDENKTNKSFHGVFSFFIWAVPILIHTF